jgi:hypothetical protein
LEEGIYLVFPNVVPTGKAFYIRLDFALELIRERTLFGRSGCAGEWENP